MIWKVSIISIFQLYFFWCILLRALLKFDAILAWKFYRVVMLRFAVDFELFVFDCVMLCSIEIYKRTHAQKIVVNGLTSPLV